LEYQKLANFLGGGDLAGGYLKEKSNKYWSTPNINFQKEYGFNAMPGGGRIYNNTTSGAGYQDQNFMKIGEVGWFATKTFNLLSSTISFRDLYFGDTRFGGVNSPGNTGSVSTDFRNGFTVRCIKD
jgi:hypothetical protein